MFPRHGAAFLWHPACLRAFLAHSQGCLLGSIERQEIGLEPNTVDDADDIRDRDGGWANDRGGSVGIMRSGLHRLTSTSISAGAWHADPD